MRIYYFGCIRESGHGWYEPGPRGVGRRGDFLPIIDGMFCPPSTQTEGLAQLVYLTPRQHYGAWTLISFWDRSVDGRGGSNSAFMLEGILSFEEATDHSKREFPEVWERFNFNVKRWVHA